MSRACQVTSHNLYLFVPDVGSVERHQRLHPRGLQKAEQLRQARPLPLEVENLPPRVIDGKTEKRRRLIEFSIRGVRKLKTAWWHGHGRRDNMKDRSGARDGACPTPIHDTTPPQTFTLYFGYRVTSCAKKRGQGRCKKKKKRGTYCLRNTNILKRGCAGEGARME